MVIVLSSWDSCHSSVVRHPPLGSSSLARPILPPSPYWAGGATPPPAWCVERWLQTNNYPLLWGKKFSWYILWKFFICKWGDCYSIDFWRQNFIATCSFFGGARVKCLRWLILEFFYWKLKFSQKFLAPRKFPQAFSKVEIRLLKSFFKSFSLLKTFLKVQKLLINFLNYQKFLKTSHHFLKVEISQNFKVNFSIVSQSWLLLLCLAKLQLVSRALFCKWLKHFNRAVTLNNIL